MTRDFPQLRRYLVTDPRAGSVNRLVAICQQALSGGVTAVQLRVKGWSDRDALDAGRKVRMLCSEAGALYLVNDRVDLALATDADGVHLGVDDLPVDVARKLMGPDAVIGYSPETEADRERAETQGANYLGVGPVYGTATKGDAGQELGLDRFREIVQASSVPVVGIGGIDIEHAREVIDAGACGVAIVSAVFFAEDPPAAARALTEATE